MSTKGVKVLTNLKEEVKLKPIPNRQEIAQKLGATLKSKFGTVVPPSASGSGNSVPDKTLLNFFRVS